MKVSCELHTFAALPPGKRSRHPLYRRLGGPQCRSARYEKKILPLLVIEPRLLGHSLVAMPTELSRLIREEYLI
jgi:hypothetical protein